MRLLKQQGTASTPRECHADVLVMDSIMSESRSALYRDLYCAIGQATTFWAGVELNLDEIVYTIYLHYGGQSLDREIPRPISKKTRFVKNALKKCPSLARYASEIREPIIRIGKMADDRDWLVHGTLGRPDIFEMTGTIVILRTVHAGNSLKFVERRIRIADIDNHAAKLRPMMNELRRIADMLAAPFEKKVEQASSSLD
jgi:hypothetical protein